MPVAYGDPRLAENFWDKVIVAPSGCWIWTAYRSPKGYGCFHAPGRMRHAHQYAFMTLVSPIPEGCELDHLCRVRRCCNPLHLDPVPHLVNVRRGNGGQNMRNKLACKRGHPFDEKNTYALPNGGRSCKECVRAKTRAWQAKRREAIVA